MSQHQTISIEANGFHLTSGAGWKAMQGEPRVFERDLGNGVGVPGDNKRLLGAGRHN